MNNHQQMSRGLRAAAFLLTLLMLFTVTNSEVAAQVAEVAVDSNQVLALAFSQDGIWLAGGGMEKKVRLWDMRTNQLLRALERPRQMVRSVAFSPDSKTMAAGSDDQVIYLWDVATGKLMQTLKGHQGMLTCVVFSPDGKALASGSIQRAGGMTAKWTCEVRLWDGTTSELQRTLLQQDGGVHGMAFSPDSKTLAMALAPFGTEKAFSGIKLWDLDAGKEKQSLAIDGGFPLSVAFSPDGNLLASGGGYAVAVDGGSRAAGEVRLWDVATGKLLRTLTGQDNGYFRSVAFSPDGKTLTSGSSGPIKDFQVGNTRGQKVVSETKLWDVATGKLLWNVEGDLGDVDAVAFSPDGTTIASCDSESVKLSDAKTGMTRQVLMTRTLKPFPK